MWMIASQKTVAMTLLADRPTLAFFGLDSPGVYCFGCSLVSALWCVVMDPCFVHGYETAQKVFLIAVEHRETLLRNGQTIAFVVC